MKGASKVLLPLVVIAALIAIWQVLADTGALADILGVRDVVADDLVPPPSAVADSLWTDRSLLADNGWVTLQEILIGFTIALVAGFAFAVAMHLNETVRRAFSPIFIASQTIPIVALAPVLVLWLGYGIGSKLFVVALVCFFPVTVNTLDGLRAVDPAAVRMMRTLRADRATVLRRLEIPAALPRFFSGAKIAAAVSAIGAVLGELVGADQGLGQLITQAQANFNTARVFAAVVWLSAFAIALYGATALAERLLTPWTKEDTG